MIASNYVDQCTKILHTFPYMSETMNRQVPFWKHSRIATIDHPWYSIRLVAITCYPTRRLCVWVENRAVGARSSDVTRSMFHQVRGHAALFFRRGLCNDKALKRTFNEVNAAPRMHVTRPFSDAVREWPLRNVIAPFHAWVLHPKWLLFILYSGFLVIACHLARESNRFLYAFKI